MEKREYEIWVGYYHLGQGHHGSTKPELIGKVEAIDFKTACLKSELENMFARISQGEESGDLNTQDYHWHFNPNKVSNNWIGKYYETEAEAKLTFKAKDDDKKEG